MTDNEALARFYQARKTISCRRIAVACGMAESTVQRIELFGKLPVRFDLRQNLMKYLEQFQPTQKETPGSDDNSQGNRTTNNQPW